LCRNPPEKGSDFQDTIASLLGQVNEGLQEIVLKSFVCKPEALVNFLSIDQLTVVPCNLRMVGFEE
jgi:hypothetical protein